MHKNKKDKKTAIYVPSNTTFLKWNPIKIVSYFIFYTVFQHFSHLIRNCETQTQPNQYFCNKQTTYYYQYFGKFLPINKNKTIESVLAGSKLH